MVCACDTSDKTDETIVVFDGNESSSLFMRFVSCTPTQQANVSPRFFFLFCLFFATWKV